MLSITDISVRIAGRLLIDHGSAQIVPGARVGFVGRNGVGKSTLFSAIRGELPTETGTISIPPRWRVGSLAQEAPNGPESLIDVVLKADLERDALLREADTAHDPHRIAEIQTRLVDIDAHSAPARAAAILDGLGFSTADQARPCSEFSGGWRMRVALAATLFAAPDLLLLDEPTNYLDLEGTLWLEDHLANYPRTVIVISHDRDLLDTSVDQFLPWAPGKRHSAAGPSRPTRSNAPRARCTTPNTPSGRTRSASDCRPLSIASRPRPRKRARPSRA